MIEAGGRRMRYSSFRGRPQVEVLVGWIKALEAIERIEYPHQRVFIEVNCNRMIYA